MKHGFRNTSPDPVVLLITTASKLGRFFQEIGKPITREQKSGPPSTDELQQFLKAGNATATGWRVPKRMPQLVFRFFKCSTDQTTQFKDNFGLRICVAFPRLCFPWLVVELHRAAKRSGETFELSGKTLQPPAMCGCDSAAPSKATRGVPPSFRPADFSGG